MDSLMHNFDTSTDSDGRSDMESRLTDSDHQALRLWLRLLATMTLIEDQIRQRLRQEFSTTLPRFDLLAQLQRNPDGLTMSELSHRLMVTGGNVTGIADQLESEGLVVREPHPTDRRSFTVRLTPNGRRLFKRMASTHESWIAELMGGLDATSKGQMYDLLAALKAHLTDVEAGRRNT